MVVVSETDLWGRGIPLGSRFACIVDHEREPETMIEEKDVQVTVRDGIRIGVRIYRPDGPGPFPTLFAASP